MKTKNYKHLGRWSRQRTCKDQSAENGNHTEGTLHGPATVPRDTRITNEQETVAINGCDGAKRKWNCGNGHRETQI